MVFEYQDATGQRRQKSESTGLPEKGNKRRAQQMLDKRLEELSQQRTAALEARNVLFLTFMSSWLDDVMAYKIRANTLSQYKMILNGYIAKYEPFHGVKLQNVTPALIQSFYNAELNAGLSSSTIRKHHSNIHKCLDYAVRLGLIANNPSAQTELPAKQKYTDLPRSRQRASWSCSRAIRWRFRYTLPQPTDYVALRSAAFVGMR